jgi:DNA-binding transcriptional MerR regulator/methylmalonyl-CoA mutase cobalamin-binding subunit
MTLDDSDERGPRLPMRMVVRRTGLSPDVLRAWERRYGVVTPLRSDGGQRLYSETDVERLRLLRRATEAGHSIQQIKDLDAPALAALVRQEEPAAAGERDRPGQSRVPATAPPDGVIAESLAAVERLDGAHLERTLRQAALTFGSATLVEGLLGPLLRQVGDRWHAGTLSPAHEHLASNVVRSVLGWVMAAHAVDGRAPRIVVATPAGERHELGAMLAAATASAEGWRTLYLGPDLPATDIAHAALEASARAVALSAIHDNGTLADEVRALARALPADVPVLVGGPSAMDEPGLAEGSAVRVLPDMPALREALRELQRSVSSAGASQAE